MSSHLEPERPDRPDLPDRVVDLDAARARKAEAGRPPRTVVLQVGNIRADGETHRQVGVSDSLQLSDLRDVLVVCFSLNALPGAEPSPWYFQAGSGSGSNSGDSDTDTVLEPDEPIHHHLGRVGDTLTFHWGLWQFQITAAHSWLRDDDTPWALCVGGSGRFGDAPFDIAAINAELTGTDTTRSVLDLANDAVRSIIKRSRIFDLVPLLQAVDLGRDVTLPEEVCSRLRELPVEDGSAAEDAFWATVLGLTCLSDTELTDDIIESIVGALGWVDDDGSALRGETVRGMCRASLEVLASVGGYGQSALPPVDRLDIYRELLRAGE